MRRNIVLGIGLVLLLTSIVSADLIISPNPVEVTVGSGTNESFELTLRNTFNFTIFEFEYSNTTGFSFPAISLEPNATKTIEVGVNINEPQEKIIDSTVRFKYLVDIPEGEQTHEINITDSGGFTPNFLVIREGDTVRWRNKDTITRSVTSGLFDEDVAPNATFTYKFLQSGTYEYQDLILFYGGTLQVLDESEAEKVNNPQYNKVLTIDLQITLDPTSLEIILEETNFTVEATGAKESVIRIRNTGNETAQNVKLSSEPNWVKFSENNFNVEPNSENILTYSIEPLILDTDDTDKNYTLAISAKGANTEEKKKSINLFIPFSNVLQDVTTSEGFLAFFARYCESNPNLIVCNNTISSGGGGSGQIQNPELNVNLTQREFLEALRRLGVIQDQISRTTSEQVTLNDQLINKIPLIEQQLNESLRREQENEDVATMRTRAFWVFIFFVAVIGVIFWVGNKSGKYFKRKANLNQGLRPTYFAR